MGMGHFECKFQTEVDVTYRSVLCQYSSVSALSFGIITSATHRLVLSQCSRVSEEQTDGRTDRILTSRTALAR